MTEIDPVQFLSDLPRDASITDGEVRRIYELGRSLEFQPVLVELGVWQGRSTVLLAQIAKECEGILYAIDHFEHPGCSRLAVVKRLSERGLAGHALVIEERTTEVLWGPLKIDFLHVDADHSSPGIDLDCAHYLPMVRAGGVVCFDDYQQLATEPHYPDVKRVADAWCSNELWDDLGVTDGMKFFRRRRP